MRSEVAKRILAKTSKLTKLKVRFCTWLFVNFKIKIGIFK